MNLIKKTLPFEGEASALLDIFRDEPGLFFLDSSLNSSEDGRYSYLGFAPFTYIKANNFKELRKTLKPYLSVKTHAEFSSGAVGQISYEGKSVFGLYDAMLRIDHQHKILTITSTGLPYRDKKQATKATIQKINYILFKMQHHHKQTNHQPRLTKKISIKSDTTAKQYIASVKKALKHIYEGDIYQINLSHRFEAKLKNWRQRIHPVDVYKHLRDISPSSFSAYLDNGQDIILSSSPERFLKLHNQVAEVRPMKGTRPRGRNPKEDQLNYDELLNSQKEKAELLMVTDLERNDLGKVCAYGKVKVKEMRRIETYATVFQATSSIEGILRADCDQFDLLESTFPSGSVTGCPKIEAMKIIKKLEKSPRGLYTGALGYISFSGDMDFNVLIRTLFLSKDSISFCVGGGIVADSDPQKEYEETLVKAQAMMKTLQEAL